MTPDPRIDWLRVTVYAALLVGLCGLATLVGWLIERFIARYGPWVMAHADAIAAVWPTVAERPALAGAAILAIESQGAT